MAPIFKNIPLHLQGNGKGRHLKIGGLTKEQKIEDQIKQNDARISKQRVAQEKLKKELDLVKQNDKQALVKEAERDQIRREVEARFQAEASDFVAVQIQQATDHLKSQFESELQSRINALNVGA